MNVSVRHLKQWQDLDVSCSSFFWERLSRLLRDESFESSLTEQSCFCTLCSVLFSLFWYLSDL